MDKNLNSKELKKLAAEIQNLKFENSYLQLELKKANSRLSAITSSKSWRLTGLLRRLFFYLRNKNTFLNDSKKAFKILISQGPSALLLKLKKRKNLNESYSKWIEDFDTLTPQKFSEMKKEMSSFKNTPKISILLPVYNTPENYLTQAIESVIKQAYENWELCICDDASTLASVEKVLETYKSNKKIKIIKRTKNGHISQASNDALSLATGEYIALLDHDDMLREHALFHIVKALNSKPNAELFYSDEDKIDSENKRFNPYFKPDWNPELLLHQNYLCHFTVISKKIVDKISGFRTGFEGAQDWDLFLRASENISIENIVHIPHVLYHWRSIPGSTAMSTSFKSYVYDNQVKAVSEHLSRRGFKDFSVSQVSGLEQLRIRFSVVEPEPLVSIIIPTKDAEGLLRTTISSLLQKTTYPNFEILVINNNSKEKGTFKYFEELKKDSRIKIINAPIPFNYSRLNNHAVKEARGSLLCFLNNDLEIINADWLTEMVSNALRPEVGAVGASLLFPDNTIQHAGVVLGIGGIAGHSHKCFPASDYGYFNRLILPSNFSAVTAACLVCRKEIFEKINGFDEENLSVAFNDVDLCLRIQELGYLNIHTPYARLYHYESATRGHENTPEKIKRFEKERNYMEKRWGELLKKDPAYNPNLTIMFEDFTLAFPPRTN